MQFFGIDLGTTTCSVSYAVNSQKPNHTPQPVVIEFSVDSDSFLKLKSPVVPSVVARPRSFGAGGDRTLFGFEAEKSYVRGESYKEIFRSVKSHLGTGRSYVRAHASLNTPVKVWAGLIRHLCEMTVAEKGPQFDPRKHPTVLTVPASFGKAQRDETIEAARLAGFQVDKDAKMVQLIDEPVAALIDTLNHADIDLHVNPDGWNTVLVFDFGGGTCDLVVLRFRYDIFKPTGLDAIPLAISQYQQIGGDTIDLALMDQVVWPQVCRQNGVIREQLTAKERKAIGDELRYKVCRSLKQHVNERLSIEQIRSQSWAGVRQEMLYSDCKPFHVSATLTADDLNEVMLPFLDPDPFCDSFTIGESSEFYSFATLIEQTMAKAGLAPDKLDLLVLHGGSCKSPFVRWGFERMRELGGLAAECKIIETPNLDTSVARGAALFGCLSKKFGKPYIAPIVPEDMYIETVGRVFEPLVHAGDQLPYTKTFSKFFLSAPGQRELVVPIHIGHDEPTERRLASTLRIGPLPEGLPQSHPIEIELVIGADKDSRWRFRPKGYDWTKAYEVANCWIGHEPTEELIELQETRKTIRALIDNNGRPTVQTLAEEALRAARAGFPEEGLALIEAVVADAEKNCTAWNIKAIIHAQRSEYQQSLESYEKATSLDPDNMVVRGNYGTALFRLGRHTEAVAVMREALSRAPSLTYLHSWLAEAYQALGDFEAMNRELERCHAHARRETIQRPDDIAAWEDLRAAALRIGRYEDEEEATETIRKLRRVDNLLAGAKHG